MKKLGFIFTAITCCILTSGADCAVRGAATTTSRNQTSQVSQRTTTGVGRSAVQQNAGGVRGRAAAVPTTNKVVGRAATTQKVINTGTKITSATANTTVNELCKTQYYGCMDSFCMLDNTSGGRCLCSDRNAELDSVLSEIQRLDEQSYAIATTGVERVEMGADADAVIAQANAVAQSFVTESKTSEKRRALDLANWNSVIDFDEDDMDSDVSLIDGKTGTALHDVVYDLCVDQIRQESPDCIKDLNMLKLMYAQQIRSDCTAYENSLKQQKTASAQKLFAAESALREAALEQYRAANKYDLGQCTIEFKKCMISTAGCGDDFSSCASVSAIDNTNTRYSKSKKGTYSIKGVVTTIDISKSTYDTLVAKKPLCETVTKSCVAVKDQVWDTFLKEVAPQLKSAELIAEDNARQNCIGSISSCFQKACKDNIDPNDPDGSYDMCLTRPDTMLNLCKVPLQACGIDVKKPESSDIWNFVVARLAAMRVDSCTTQVKECLQSDDRCGDDYTQCVGLDTDTIMRMCPYEKLIGCQQVYGDKDITGNAVYDEIASMVQGVMLTIDNNMLDYCQNALDTAMIKVCGDTENCDNLAVDEGVGSRSFKYQVCQYKAVNGDTIEWLPTCRDSLEAINEQELKEPGNGAAGWAGKLSGLVYWGDITYSQTEQSDGTYKFAFTTVDEYINNLESKGYKLSAEDKEIIQDRVFGQEIRGLTNAVVGAISAIESDPTVQYCMTGREVQGMRIGDKLKNLGDKSNGGRFPQLTQQVRSMIAASALKTAKNNYNVTYDKETTRMMQDQVKAAKRIDRDAAMEIARNTCTAWAESSSLPVSSAPKVSNVGKWIALGLLVAVAVVASVFTFGTAAAGAAGIIGSAAASGGVAGFVGTAVVAGTVVGSALMASSLSEPVGEAKVDQWNYKENITTLFNSTTGECTRVRIVQNCEKVKKNYCEVWEDSEEIKDTVNLMDE